MKNYLMICTYIYSGSNTRPADPPLAGETKQLSNFTRGWTDLHGEDSRCNNTTISLTLPPPPLQENLRGKLEQLSTMYEEVSARMENLEKAYAQAEVEVGIRTFC